MENGWIKWFAGQEPEYGLDRMIAAGVASWRKGRLLGMVGAEVHFNERAIKLSSDKPGEFWQSDSFKASMLGGSQSLVIRRIQRKIEEHDRCLDIYKTKELLQISVYSGLQNKIYTQLIAVQEAWKGQWLTLEIYPETLEWKISRRRI